MVCDVEQKGLTCKGVGKRVDAEKRGARLFEGDGFRALEHV